MALGFSALSEAPLSDLGVIPLALVARSTAYARGTASSAGSTFVAVRATASGRGGASLSGEASMAGSSFAGLRASAGLSASTGIISSSLAASSAGGSVARSTALTSRSLAASMSLGAISGSTLLLGSATAGSRGAAPLGGSTLIAARSLAAVTGRTAANFLLHLYGRAATASRGQINLRYKGAEPSQGTYDDMRSLEALDDAITLPSESIIDYSANSYIINDEMH